MTIILWINAGRVAVTFQWVPAIARMITAVGVAASAVAVAVVKEKAGVTGATVRARTIGNATRIVTQMVIAALVFSIPFSLT